MHKHLHAASDARIEALKNCELFFQMRFRYNVTHQCKRIIVTAIAAGSACKFGFGRNIRLANDIACRLIRMRLLPELPRDAQRVYFLFIPPGYFVSRLMELPVMAAAERDRKLVAHLDAERARLCEAEMVGIARVAPADDARLGRNKTKM